MNHWLNQLASGWLIATFCHKLIHILWYISHQYSMKIGIYMMIHIWYISILLDLWYPINFPRFLQISYSNDIILTGRLVRAPRDSWLAPARGSSFQRPKKWGESLIWSGWGSHGFHVENMWKTGKRWSSSRKVVCVHLNRCILPIKWWIPEVKCPCFF